VAIGRNQAICRATKLSIKNTGVTRLAKCHLAWNGSGRWFCTDKSGV